MASENINESELMENLIPESSQIQIKDTEVETDNNANILLEEDADDTPTAEEENDSVEKNSKEVVSKKHSEDTDDIESLVKKSQKPVESASKTQKRKIYKSEHIITDDGDEEIKTEATIMRKEYIELSASAQAGRILSGEVCGCRYTDSRNSKGTLLTEIAYGEQTFSVLIPAYLLFDYDEDEIRTDEDRQKLELAVRRRYGSIVDFVVRKVIEKDRVAYASRLQALSMKAKENYITLQKDGKPRIVDGLIVKSKVVTVGRKYIVVDALGTEIRIDSKECSYNYIGDCREEFSVGDSVNVRVSNIRRYNSKKSDMTYPLIEANGSIKDALPDNRKALFNKYQVGGKYAAVVSNVSETGVYVRLNDKYDCLCAFPKFGIMPQIGQKRIVEITEKNEKDLFIFGIMSKM